MKWLHIFNQKQKKPETVYVIEIETLTRGVPGYDSESYTIHYANTPDTIFVASVEPALRILKGDFMGCDCADGGEFLINRSIIKTINILPALNTPEDAKHLDSFIADKVDNVKVIGWYNYWKEGSEDEKYY